MLECPTKKLIRIGTMQVHGQTGREIYSCLGEGLDEEWGVILGSNVFLGV